MKNKIIYWLSSSFRGACNQEAWVKSGKTYQFYLLLILACFSLYLPGIAKLPLIDRDSAHFVQATKQMVETGNYFQIRFQEKTRFQKPPGINWLQSLSVKIFTDAQAKAIWPYRIPSFLGGLFATLLTFAFTRLVWGNAIAFLAALLLASTSLLTLESHLAVTDATLTACMLLMQGSLWRIYLNKDTVLNNIPLTFKANGTNAIEISHNHNSLPNIKQQHPQHINESSIFPLLFWLALSLGILIKGVTPLFALLTIMTLCICDRNLTLLKALKIQWGLPILLISSSWLFWVSQAEGTNYLHQMIQKDLLPKLVSGHESHGALPGFHLLILPLTLWPASLFLWPAAAWAWQYKNQPSVKFLLAWLISAWAFFELMPTKLPQYVLPVFPVLCILAANAIYYYTSAVSLTPTKHSRWLKLLYAGWGLLGLGIASVFLIIPYALHQSFSLLNFSCLLLVMFMTALCLYDSYHQRYLKSAYTAIIGVIFIYALLFHAFLPQLAPLWLSEKIASSVQQYATQQPTAHNPLLVVGYGEPSLVFLLGTHNVKFTTLTELKQLIPSFTNKKQLILLEQQLLTEIQPTTEPAKIALRELTTLKGFNYSKGKWTNLILLEGTNNE